MEFTINIPEPTFLLNWWDWYMGLSSNWQIGLVAAVWYVLAIPIVRLIASGAPEKNKKTDDFIAGCFIAWIASPLIVAFIALCIPFFIISFLLVPKVKKK